MSRFSVIMCWTFACCTMILPYPRAWGSDNNEVQQNRQWQGRQLEEALNQLDQDLRSLEDRSRELKSTAQTEWQKTYETLKARSQALRKELETSRQDLTQSKKENWEIWKARLQRAYREFAQGLSRAKSELFPKSQEQNSPPTSSQHP